MARLFLIEPATHHAANCTVSKDFNMNSKCQAFNQIGMSMAGFGWNNMLEQLPKKVSVADAFQYDSSHGTEVLIQTARCRQACMEFRDNEEVMLFNNVRRNIIYKHVVGQFGEIIEDGNPSGQYNTTLDNSIVGEHGLAYSWYKQTHSTVVPYYDKIGAAIVGDDIMAGLHSAVLERKMDWQAYWHDCFAELGFDYTFGPLIPREEAQFVSHITNRFYGRRVPALVDKRFSAKSRWVRFVDPGKQLESLSGVLDSGLFNSHAPELHERLSKYIVLPSLHKMRCEKAFLESAGRKNDRFKDTVIEDYLG
jgi:hypothetical protein